MPPRRIGTGRAGDSGREGFRKLRREALRRKWRDWTVLLGLILVAAAGVAFLRGGVRLISAFMLGVAVTTATVGWIIGGEVWSLPWAWGAVGEEMTADALEALDGSWWVEHDIPHAYGNFDHIVVGPPGVFLLDSKKLSRPAFQQNDELRAGVLRYSGRVFRRGAVTLGEAIASSVGSRPWVQAVVVVWGKLGHETREENHVVYLRGQDLVPWLCGQPQRTSSDRCDAIAEAVSKLRAASGANI